MKELSRNVQLQKPTHNPLVALPSHVLPPGDLHSSPDSVYQDSPAHKEVPGTDMDVLFDDSPLPEGLTERQWYDTANDDKIEAIAKLLKHPCAQDPRPNLRLPHLT